MTGRAFYILTVLFVLVIIFCVKGTVQSRENDERERQNRHYAVLEQEYLERAQDLLEREGYGSCGINMRRVTYGEGRREYTVMLHHRKLKRISDSERLELKDMLSKMEFQDDACRFIYELETG